MKKQKLLYGGGALGAVFLPQLFSHLGSNPAALSNNFPTAGCTGSCGNCGGSCLGFIAPLLFLSICAYRGKKQ